MKIFHFHDWTKWEEYDRKFSDWNPPMSKSNWYGYFERWTEKWEHRECKVCGKHQHRRSKSSFHLGEENGDISHSSKWE